MWVPLTSKDSSATFHEIYLIDRDESGKFSYNKIMDARYAQLRSVEE